MYGFCFGDIVYRTEQAFHLRCSNLYPASAEENSASLFVTVVPIHGSIERQHARVVSTSPSRRRGRSLHLPEPLGLIRVRVWITHRLDPSLDWRFLTLDDATEAACP